MLQRKRPTNCAPRLVYPVRRKKARKGSNENAAAIIINALREFVDLAALRDEAKIVDKKLDT